MSPYKLSTTERWKIWWRVTLEPFTLRKFDAKWDKTLNKMLDDGKPIQLVRNYTMKVDDVEVWIGNFPFAYGERWELTEGSADCTKSGSPSKKTRIRLREIELFLRRREKAVSTIITIVEGNAYRLMSWPSRGMWIRTSNSVLEVYGVPEDHDAETLLEDVRSQLLGDDNYESERPVREHA